ncbi:hypothetical protein HY496_02800 [Candidatus Woesearchaeota archaeon]|nr:hypothetical protein [Candidatus Woesearchaeota archaeon]
MEKLLPHFEWIEYPPGGYIARLYEHGKPLIVMEFCLSPITRTMTAEVLSYEPGHGHARRLLDLTIPQKLEEIAQREGSFEHHVRFTPSGRKKLYHIFLEKGYALSTRPLIDLVREY